MLLMIIFKCEDECQEVHCLDNSILRCQCKCGKIMKPERIVYENGYIGITNETGYRELEHRFIWRINNGKIPKDKRIHHINGDKKDNRIGNLMCLTVEEHMNIHKELRRLNKMSDKILTN